MVERDEYGKLFQILREEDLDLAVYVYRVDSRGKRQKPHLWRTYPHEQLLEVLRDKYGGGDFYLMIREGNQMVYSGAFSVWGPRMNV